MSFVELVAMSLADDKGLLEYTLIHEELQRRLSNLSAHNRVRLGMVK